MQHESTNSHIDQLSALVCLGVRRGWLAPHRDKGRQDDDLSPANGTDGGGDVDGYPPDGARPDDSWL